MDTVEASDSLPHPRALHPALPDVNDLAVPDPLGSKTDTQTSRQQETITRESDTLHPETDHIAASISDDVDLEADAGPINLT
jgi:hypothetical protein